jgi:Asp/Glu/hydantoin racemase
MIIPINDRAFDDKATAFINSSVQKGFKVTVRSLRHGSKRIESRYDVAINGKEVINDITKMILNDELLEYSGIFISDYDRSGVDPVRELVGIPVVGGSGPQLATLVDLCQKFAILTVDDVLTPMNVSLIREYGLSDSLVGIYDIDMRIADLADANPTLVMDRLLEQAVRAVLDGAQSIVLGCTGFLGIAERLQLNLEVEVRKILEGDVPPHILNKLKTKHLPSWRLEDMKKIYIPVLDPNILAINFLAMLVQCRIAQSEVCYRTPPGLEEELKAKKQAHRRQFLNS